MIDFRSDTVTRPTAGMMAAIQQAELGDDVYGDDPTTNTLEQLAADLFGKEAGLFLSSGTQSNLAGVLAHCGRGEEILIGRGYHIQAWEAGGASALGGVVMHGLATDERGALRAQDIRAAIKPDDFHAPISRLLSVENTVSGVVHPVSYMDEMASLAHDNGLKLHCDGARIMNAVVALGVDPARLVEGCDTVSVCLSKGLGTPAGSVLVGDLPTITKARRIRKMLGGGMRQSGIIAAAGIYALTHHVDRMAEDHRRAKWLATELSALDGLHVDIAAVETNMLFATLEDHIPVDDLGDFMADQGIILSAGRTTRIVTHLDIDDAACQTLKEAMAEFISRYEG
jgi:threonine aldolase